MITKERVIQHHQLTTKYLNDVWIFDKRPIKLKNLNYDQLNIIKKKLNDHRYSTKLNGNKIEIVAPYYNGKPDTYWRKALKTVEKYNDYNTFKEAVSNLLIENRVKKAEKLSDDILNIILIKTKQDV